MLYAYYDDIIIALPEGEKTQYEYEYSYVLHISRRFPCVMYLLFLTLFYVGIYTALLVDQDKSI